MVIDKKFQGIGEDPPQGNTNIQMFQIIFSHAMQWYRLILF